MKEYQNLFTSLFGNLFLLLAAKAIVNQDYFSYFSLHYTMIQTTQTFPVEWESNMRPHDSRISHALVVLKSF